MQSTSSLESIRKIANQYLAQPPKSALEGFHKYLQKVSPEKRPPDSPSTPSSHSSEFPSFDLHDTSADAYYQGFEYGAGLGALLVSLRKWRRRCKARRFAKWKYLAFAAQQDAEVTVVELRYIEKLLNALRAGLRLRARKVGSAFFKWKFQRRFSVQPLVDTLDWIVRRRKRAFIARLPTERVLVQTPLLRHVLFRLTRQLHAAFRRWHQADQHAKSCASLGNLKAILDFKATQTLYLQRLCRNWALTHMREMSTAMSIWRTEAGRKQANQQTAEGDIEEEGRMGTRTAKLSRKVEVHREALEHGRTKLWCLAATEAVTEVLADLS